MGNTENEQRESIFSPEVMLKRQQILMADQGESNISTSQYRSKSMDTNNQPTNKNNIVSPSNDIKPMNQLYNKNFKQTFKQKFAQWKENKEEDLQDEQEEHEIELC